jgi:hypothetical protein
LGACDKIAKTAGAAGGHREIRDQEYKVFKITTEGKKTRFSS